MGEMYSHIVGLDLSLTDTGMAAIHRTLSGRWGLTAISHCAVEKNIYDPQRQFIILKVIREFLYHNLRHFKPSAIAVVIEDYAFGRVFGKSFTRAELGGMVKHTVLTEFGYPVYLVSPSALKRFMDCSGGKKNKDKDAMFQAASRKFRFINTNDNIVDAYCLCQYLVANKEGQKLTLVRHDALPQYRSSSLAQSRPVQVPASIKKVIGLPKIGY